MTNQSKQIEIRQIIETGLETSNQKIEEVKKPSVLQTKNELIDILYEVIIVKGNEETDISESDFNYSLNVKNTKTNKSWIISRNYSDFLWLFNALKMALPGYILPYFPASSVTKYLHQKLLYFNSKERSMYLSSQTHELRNFIKCITTDQKFGFTEQLRVFLIQNHQQHQKAMRKMNMLTEELNLSQSTNFSIGSFYWFKQNKPSQKRPYNKEWMQTKQKVSQYSSQLFSLVEKLCMLKRAKEDQIFWKGPLTEIDSIQHLKVKIQSAKPYGQIFNAQIEAKLLFPLIIQCKKQGQMQQMIKEKESTEQLINHLIQVQGNQNRINKLIVRTQKFQCHFVQNWQKINTDWLTLIDQLDRRFKRIFESYSHNMLKIWK